MPHTSLPRRDSEGFPVQGHGTHAVVHLSGELGPETISGIDAAVTLALRHAANVLIDMHQVTYVHQLAWIAFVRAAQRVRQAGSFAMFGASHQPQGRFEILGLKSLFSSFTSLEEAVIGLVLSPTSPRDRGASILLNHILRIEGNTFTARDLLSRVPRDVFPNSAALAATLDIVEKQGHIARIPAQPERRPGRPPSACYVIRRNTAADEHEPTADR